MARRESDRSPAAARSVKEKREELKTYRELALRRDLKSKAQRRRVEASGARRVIGDGSGTHPYLVVDGQRYRDVRMETQRDLLLEARKCEIEIPVDRLLRQLRPRIEAITYARLAEESSHEALRHVPVAALGRALTAEERRQFAASRAATASTEKPGVRAASTALNHVLGSIEQRQAHNPARYQTIWAQAVGSEAAQQSQLDHVDAATQTAWFRCYNSVLSSDLQRRRGLAQKLSSALGVPVRQLRAKF
jgi:hypothetical protein